MARIIFLFKHPCLHLRRTVLYLSYRKSYIERDIGVTFGCIKVNRRHPIVVCTLDNNKDNAINTTIFIIKAIFVFIQNAVCFEP
jgi:hypothetical protein